MQLKRNLIIAWLLNLLLPGLGHFYYKEFSFGLFIYLITLLASVLFVAMFFVPLPWYAELLIFWLPILFYLFTFVDLTRTAKLKRTNFNRSRRGLVLFLVVGLGYQILAPPAAINFGWRNRPEIYTTESTEGPVQQKRSERVVCAFCERAMLTSGSGNDDAPLRVVLMRCVRIYFLTFSRFTRQYRL